MEEKLFQDHYSKYSKIVRRGLTIYQNQKTNNQRVLRKGLPKFFDLDINNLLTDDISIHPFKYYGLQKNLNFDKKNITLIVTQKLNGFNVQISYDKTLDQFIIASKNKSKFLQEKIFDLNQTIEIHSDKINEYFLNFLKNFDNKKLDILKEFLENHTLIGEYIGGFFNQHITYEKDEKIIFFAITNKNSFDNDVLPFQQSNEILKNFGFETVEFKIFQGDQSEILQQTKNILSLCIQQPIDIIGEGFVLYFEIENQLKYIAKLKSLQYIIERIYRETCRELFEAKNLGPNSGNKIVENNKRRIFQRISQYKIDEKQQEILQQKIDEEMVHILFGTINNQINPDNWISYRYQQFFPENEKSIFFIIPIGIPGMGKTHFIEHILAPQIQILDLKIYSVSSDQIMLTLMGDPSQLNPSQKKDKFNKLRKQSKRIYDHKFTLILQLIQEEIYNVQNKGIIVVKDKNHMFSSLERELKYIKSFFYNKNYKLILAIPEQKNDICPSISSDVFLNCIYNIKTRNNNNMILTYEGLNTYEILMQFQKNYKEFNFEKFNVDGVIEYMNKREIKNNQAKEDLQKFIKNIKIIKKKQFEELMNQLEVENFDEKKNQIIFQQLQKVINQTMEAKKFNFQYLCIYLQHQHKLISNLLHNTLKVYNKAVLIGEIKKWNQVIDLHVTLFHRNDKIDEQKEDLINQYKINEQINIEITGILLTENRNILFIVSFEDKDKIIPDKNHHITFAFKNSKPFHSNQIISLVKQQNPEIEKSLIKQQFEIEFLGNKVNVDYLPCEKTTLLGFKKKIQLILYQQIY